MCGICGIVNFTQPGSIDAAVLDRMTRTMQHRGPDDQGLYHDDYVGLGARRLSIIDLPGGHQPITNEAQTHWIIFNGEIYNYRELRNHLLHLGHHFQTNSDTEVILHLYEEYGPDCVTYLNGMFAFAIWDQTDRRVFIARDRVGIKPLYYAQVGSNLIFGSELKVVLANPLINRRVNLNALNEYLSYEYVPTPNSIIRDVSKLPPGHTLTFSQQSGLVIQPYWDVRLERSEQLPPVDYRDYVDQLQGKLQSCIAQEMVSDVPVGVLLSGGLDSSAVAAYMAKAAPGRIKSFSIAFEDASFDESHFARMVARHVGTEHHELRLTGSMAAQLTSNITDFLDEPFADSSLIPSYLLAKFAREHVKVVLGGDGGDELFVGYPTFVAHRMIQMYERFVPHTVRASVVPRILKMLPVSFNNLSTDFKLRRFLSGRGVPLQARHHRWLWAFVDEQKAQLLQEWVKPTLLETYHRAYQHARQTDAHTPLNQLVYNDMKMYLESDILFKVDRATMAASLEARVPLLNRDLIDHVTQLPLELKLRRFTGKYIFRKAVAPLLPPVILNRPKKGFNMPVAKWFQNELRELLLDTLSESALKRQQLFCVPYVKRLIDDHLNQRSDNRKELWTLLIFQLWSQKYLEA